MPLLDRNPRNRPWSNNRRLAHTAAHRQSRNLFPHRHHLRRPRCTDQCNIVHCPCSFPRSPCTGEYRSNTSRRNMRRNNSHRGRRIHRPVGLVQSRSLHRSCCPIRHRSHPRRDGCLGPRHGNRHHHKLGSHSHRRRRLAHRKQSRLLGPSRPFVRRPPRRRSQRPHYHPVHLAHRFHRRFRYPSPLCHHRADRWTCHR